MDQIRQAQSDINAMNDRLAKAFLANGRYNPHFLGVAGLGFIAIYFLTRSGVFGEPAPQLLVIGVLTILLALAEQWPALWFARQRKGLAANFTGALSVGIYCILLTFLWEGVLPLAILLALITPAAAIRTGMPRRHTVVMLMTALGSIIGIIFAERNNAIVGNLGLSITERLHSSSPAAIASFAFLGATGLLLLTITIISQNRNFKTLQSLLLLAFVAIVTIPTIMAAVLSAVGTLTNSQTQAFSTLKAIARLKESQTSILIERFETDAERIQNDSEFFYNALNVLKDKNNESSLLDSYKRFTRSRMAQIIIAEEEVYKEVMVLNTEGDVLISTVSASEGQNFQDQLFFRQGTLRFYAGFADADRFGEENLIAATPIYDSDGRIIRGVLVLRSNAMPVERIMESTPGFEQAETYLVDKNYKPVTRTYAPTDAVRTKASLDAILQRSFDQNGIYENYARQSVLGYYEWFEPLQVAVIAEVPLDVVVSSSIKPLVGSGVLALFVIIIAVAAVVISARSIVEPITTLAQTTESFAAGKLSTRAIIDRQDEIGALARSYNQMAAQLQETIGALEQRVAERTTELENQTLRLRAAAEIARDSTSARDLGELLERSAQLILKRFSFYHTGIFLLDHNKEFAVLAASPTEAGRKMLATHHKLRVGEVGIVGRVAATGEPRITLDTGIDAVHFNNPFLPNTRSEMALPLKADNVVIGVLDIQSEEPHAFTEDDIAIMQTLADQLATAIERTRLLQEVERSLKELESAYGQYTEENWRRLSDRTQAGNKGYRFDNIRIESISHFPDLGEKTFTSGSTTISTEGRQSTAAIPIKLRGQTIGVISLKLKEDYAEDTISTIELASERLASALESARLYEEARLRADREQSISRVTTAISSSTAYEEILQTTVREIGSTLKDAEISIQVISHPDAPKIGS